EERITNIADAAVQARHAIEARSARAALIAGALLNALAREAVELTAEAALAVEVGAALTAGALRRVRDRQAARAVVVRGWTAKEALFAVARRRAFAREVERAGCGAVVGGAKFADVAVGGGVAAMVLQILLQVAATAKGEAKSEVKAHGPSTLTNFLADENAD